jgi:ATP:ADP antiporter, AAA family
MIHPLRSIRPEERRAVYGAFVTLWGILAGHSLLETARDALFLGSLPASRLPWVYLFIAITSVVLLRLQGRLPIGRDHRRVLGSLLLGSAATTFVLWMVLTRPHPWVLFAVYVWAGVFATIVVTRFWMVVQDVFTVTQAKRLFAIIGAGSVAGAITGSAMARGLAELVEPRHFLLVASFLIAGVGSLPLLLLSASETGREHDDDGRAGNRIERLRWRQTLRVVVERPYVKRLLGMVLLSTFVLTLVDYLFKSIVARELPAEALAGFFSTTYLALNLLSLLLQLTLVGSVLRAFGLHRVLGLTPLLLAVTAAGLVVVYTVAPLAILLPALALKTVDGSLRHSLHRTSVETLFVPLSRGLREQVKVFIDVLGQRGGQAIASVFILVAIALPAPEASIGLAVVVLGLAWIRVASDLRIHYLDLFRDTLAGNGTQGTLDFPELDLASLETLIARLNSDNDLEVRAALDMLAEQERVHLVPALILYHPSEQVVIRALELFAQQRRKDTLPILVRLADHEDARVRAAVLRTRSLLAPDVNRQLKEFLDDPSPVVRATALVTLVSANWIQGDDAEKALRNIATDASVEESIALAQSVQQQPDPVHAALLLQLASREDPSLRLEVVRAMRAVADPRFIDALLEMLPVRARRGEARQALVRIGGPALEALDAALGNEDLVQNVRRHIPRTLSRFAPVEAAPILVRHALDVRDGLVRFKILRALGSLRRRDRDLPLDESVLRRGIELTLSGSFRLLDWRAALLRGASERPERATAAHELLLHTLDHKQSHAKERLFRLLGLLLPQEDWERIYRGLDSPRPQDRASSHELIEALLDPPLRDALLGFVDALPDRERLLRGVVFHSPRAWRYEEVLEEFLDRGSLGLRCITLYHIGELRITALRPRLEAMLGRPPEVQQQVVRRALELLDHPEAERIAHE